MTRQLRRPEDPVALRRTALLPPPVLFGGQRPPPSVGRPETILWADPRGGEADPGVQALRRHGYEVVHVGSPAALPETLRERHPDVVLLEAIWPQEDGLTLCREMADASGPPVIVYSASTNSLDCVTSLEFGADDFVSKAAHPLELLARVRALLRRVATAGRPAAPSQFTWNFHENLRCLFGPNGGSVYLSPADCDLLASLARHPRQVVSRDEIAGSDPEADVTARAIDRRVVRLRRVMDACDGGGYLIKTVRGGGYALNAAVERAASGALLIAPSHRA
jgi:two-component system OmpR family response regulator